MQQPSLAMPPLPTRPEEVPGIFGWFQRMREGHPVALDAGFGSPSWHVFRYDDVVRVLTDHAHFSSRVPAFEYGPVSDTKLAKDPPDHRKLRSLVNLAFTPRAVARLSDRVAELCERLLDRVRDTGEMDLISAVAAPLPAQVICEMLGVPESDWDAVLGWWRLDGPRGATPMRAYFSDLLETRRRSPRDDLFSALSAAEVDGQRLSERELLNFCNLLFLAGHLTTRNLIANFFLTLSDHPDDQTRLTRQPELIPTAVEEVLRVLPPVWFLMRRTTEDVEVGGVRIPAGQTVICWPASANRDATQFPDPDRFDATREPNRHLGFGHGIHFCVGAPLSRLEAAVALPMLLEQLEDVRVTRERPIGIRAGIVFNITNLPVTFRPY